jgi:hypothetical protein
MPLPTGFQNSHQNGGQVLLIFVADPRTTRLCMNREHVGDAVGGAQRRRRLQEGVLRGQAALGERAKRECLGVAQPDSPADGILNAHKQIPQLV